MTFTPNSSAVVARLADNSIRVISIADSKEIKNVWGTGASFSDSPRRRTISAAGDKTVRFWNAADWAAKGNSIWPGCRRLSR